MDKIRLYKRDFSLEILKMKDLDISNPFFGSFVTSYAPYYFDWYEQKKEDPILVAREDENIRGLLKLKIEEENEDYSDLSPVFEPKKRLKICSLKVEPNDACLSSIFMEIIMREAIIHKVAEVYGSIRHDSNYMTKLSFYLQKWGFNKTSDKYSKGILEDIYVHPIDNDINILQDSRFEYANNIIVDKEDLFRQNFVWDKESGIPQEVPIIKSRKDSDL